MWKQKANDSNKLLLKRAISNKEFIIENRTISIENKLVRKTTVTKIFYI